MKFFSLSQLGATDRNSEPILVRASTLHWLVPVFPGSPVQALVFTGVTPCLVKGVIQQFTRESLVFINSERGPYGALS